MANRSEKKAKNDNLFSIQDKKNNVNNKLITENRKGVHKHGRKEKPSSEIVQQTKQKKAR